MSSSEEQQIEPPVQGPAKDFTDFCEAEFERRRNSDEDFDEVAYADAMKLVLHKLRKPSGGDAA